MKAYAIANADFVVSRIDDRLYGAFLEHLGRAICAYDTPITVCHLILPDQTAAS